MHSPLPDEGKIIFSLVSTIRDKVNILIAQALAEQGINDILPAHGAVLHALFMENPLSMGALATAIKRKKNTVTSLINTLEARGYCQRLTDPNDARVQLISLTPKAESLRKIQAAISTQLLETAWKNISAEEVTGCIRTLQSLLFNLEQSIGNA